jgi:hypothetical protein
LEVISEREKIWRQVSAIRHHIHETQYLLT